MSSKACDHYSDCRRQRLYRQLFACVLTVIILVLFVVLLVWLILRPSKPAFYLRDVTISQLNVTAPPSALPAPTYLSTNLQVTLSSRNPNSRIGIYYDKVDVYAVYKGERVTVPTALPPGYQGHHDFAVWSPFLYGTSIPVSPYLAEALSQDRNAGFLLIAVKLDGTLRWKVGTWISGDYHLNVNCPAFLTVSDANADAGSGFKFQQMVTCTVDV